MHVFESPQLKLQPKQHQSRRARAFYYLAGKINRAIDAAQEKSASRPPSKFSVFFDKMVDKEVAKSRFDCEQSGVADRNIKKISKWNSKFLGWKRKMLRRIGVDEAKIIEAFGIPRSFFLAKLGSKLDIFQEVLNWSIGFSYGLFAIATTAYVSLKFGLPHIDPALPEMSPSEKQYFSEILSILKYPIYAIVPVAFCMRALTKIGNYLDFFQHMFMESIANSFPPELQPQARKHYDAFAFESVREMIMDTVLSYIPIPLIDFLRRIRAIKLELRQLGHIKRMEKLYMESLNSKEPSSA
jgi:hypothetical protein